MTSAIPLLKDVLLVIHATLQGTWNVGDRLALNSGTICETTAFPQVRCFVPKHDWRPLDVEEMSFFVAPAACSSPSLTESLLVFALPYALQERFWDLDVEQLFGGVPTTSSDINGTYRMFLADVINSMINDLGFTISGPCTCTVAVNKPGLASTRLHHEKQIYTGLQIDQVEPVSPHDTGSSQSLAYINLGDESSTLVVINLTIKRILELLGSPGTIATDDMLSYGVALAHLFLSTFPDYPVLKLMLMPGEGLIIPARRIIHDGSTLGKVEPDILLKMQACFIAGNG